MTKKIFQVYRSLRSVLTLPCCRFVPSCSYYSEQAIEAWGLWRGLWLTAKRILRCHPFCQGGYDPPPVQLKVEDARPWIHADYS